MISATPPVGYFRSALALLIAASEKEFDEPGVQSPRPKRAAVRMELAVSTDNIEQISRLTAIAPLSTLRSVGIVLPTTDSARSAYAA